MFDFIFRSNYLVWYNSHIWGASEPFVWWPEFSMWRLMHKKFALVLIMNSSESWCDVCFIPIFSYSKKPPEFFRILLNYEQFCCDICRPGSLFSASIFHNYEFQCNFCTNWRFHSGQNIGIGLVENIQSRYFKYLYTFYLDAMVAIKSLNIS